MTTGWDNGLSQDYNKGLGTWFADRLGARQRLRVDMEAKNEALELAQELEEASVDGTLSAMMGHAAAALLRSQYSEIEQVKAELQRVYALIRSHAELTFKAEDERDQLKAKNEKLVEALNELMNWQAKNVKAWHNSAYDNAIRSLRENT